MARLTRVVVPELPYQKYGDVHGCPSGMKLLASPVRLVRIRYHYLKEKIVTMSEMPPCPKCQSPYVYEDGALLVCPECAHEWAKDAAGATPAEDSDALVVRDAHGTVLADGELRGQVMEPLRIIVQYFSPVQLLTRDLHDGL